MFDHPINCPACPKYAASQQKMSLEDRLGQSEKFFEIDRLRFSYMFSSSLFDTVTISDYLSPS